MKKFLLLILFFPLFLFSQTTITIWHSYRGEEKIALEKTVKIFNKTDKTFKVKLLAIPYDAFSSKLSNAIPNGNGPDGFIFAHEKTGSWSNEKIISSLPQNVVEQLKKNLIFSTIKALKFKQKFWGIPIAFKNLALFYRSDRIKSPPKTVEEMISLAQKFSDEKNQKYGLAFQTGSLYFLAPFIYGFDGGFCLDKKNACIDSPNNIKAVNFIKDLILNKKIIPQETTSALISQLFNDNKATMVINGPWFLGEINKNVPFKVALLPKFKNGKYLKPFLTVEALFISGYKNSNKKGVLKFGEFLVSNKIAKIRALDGKQLVSTQSVYEDKEIKKNKILAVFKQESELAIPMNSSPKMRMVWTPFSNALKKVFRGNSSAKEALKEASKEYEIFSKPLPKSQNPVVYLAILLLFALISLVFLYKKAKKGNIFGEIKNHKTPYLYLFPALLSMLLLVFIPFSVGTAVAFFAHRSGEFHFVGFSNFISILLSQDFAITNPMSFYFTLAVTILWTTLNVFLHLSIGLILAMLLKNEWLKLKGIYRILLIIPWAVPNYITALIWKGMFNKQFGAINAILKNLGLEPVNWFSNFWTAFSADVITNTWLGFPFMMVTALGALQAIPRELEDAASVDGANFFQRFKNVTLPLLKPALLPAVILGSVWTFNMFNIIFLVSGGEPNNSTEILISEAYKWAFQRQERYGYAAAYATIIFIVLLFYSKATDKLSKKR